MNEQKVKEKVIVCVSQNKEGNVTKIFCQNNDKSNLVGFWIEEFKKGFEYKSKKQDEVVLNLKDFLVSKNVIIEDKDNDDYTYRIIVEIPIKS